MPNTVYSWNIGRGIWNGLFGDYFMRDDFSDAQTVITFPHHEIHEGDHYFVEDYLTLGSGGTIAFSVQTGSSLKRNNILWDAQSTGAVMLDVYEYGSASTGGTSLTPQNSNRAYPNNSETAVEYDPTIVDLGTRMSGKAWGVTGNPAQVEGGEAGRENELVLGTDRNYIYHFTSSSADNVFSYHAHWYEHAPSN